MSREFLGSGWKFPVETDSRGNIEMSGEDAGIEESIKLIIGTAKGERIMRPEFGCEVHDYAFSSVTPKTLNLIESSIRKALIEWEPRIDIEGVDAYRDEQNASRVLIDIEYEVRSTNSVQNMVYPFYLKEGEA